MKSCEILKPCGIFSFRIASRLPTSTVKSRRSCENDCGGDWRRDDEVPRSPRRCEKRRSWVSRKVKRIARCIKGHAWPCLRNTLENTAGARRDEVDANTESAWCPSSLMSRSNAAVCSRTHNCMPVWFILIEKSGKGVFLERSANKRYGRDRSTLSLGPVCPFSQWTMSCWRVHKGRPAGLEILPRYACGAMDRESERDGERLCARETACTPFRIRENQISYFS